MIYIYFWFYGKIISNIKFSLTLWPIISIYIEDLAGLTGLSNRPETQVNTVVTALRSGNKTGLTGQKLGVFDSSGSARPNKSQPSE
jgi:hypothetical protein